MMRKRRSWETGGLKHGEIYEEKKKGLWGRRSEQPQIRKTAPLNEEKDLGPVYLHSSRGRLRLFNMPSISRWMNATLGIVMDRVLMNQQFNESSLDRYSAVATVEHW
jgi:hypothetical protein